MQTNSPSNIQAALQMLSKRIIWLVPSTVLQLTDTIVSEQKQL